MSSRVHQGASIALGLAILLIIGITGMVVALTPQVITHCAHTPPPYFGPAYPIINPRDVPSTC